MKFVERHVGDDRTYLYVEDRLVGSIKSDVFDCCTRRAVLDLFSTIADILGADLTVEKVPARYADGSLA